jgi:predicted ferric reductase
MTVLDLCAYVGLAAVATASTNMLVGLLIALRYSPVRLWPHRRLNIFRLHNWTAYLVLVLIIVHPMVLVLNRSPHFGLGDLLFPTSSPVQPKMNTVGAISLYALLVVILTSLLRRYMRRPAWRKLHYLVFPAAVLMFIHSVFTDPELSTGKPDLLDGGKVMVEVCLAISLVAWILRLRLRGKGLRPVQQELGNQAVTRNSRKSEPARA